MLKTRVIPILLLKNQGLVKTTKFKEPKYIGDPLNTVKIFNEKEVDELIIVDITASVENKKINFKLISEIASECFMPLCYGGAIKTLEEIKELFSLGIEKVAINSYAVENPSFIKSAAELFGNQSIVVSIDYKRNFLGKYEIFTHGGTINKKIDPVIYAQKMAELGAGEILLNSIDRDGTMQGYDIDLIKRVSESVNIPVIACGGAGKLDDFTDAVKKGQASAVAAGSMFVYQGKHKAVLISYPAQTELQKYL